MNSSFGQFSDKEKKELYPESYTFEQAEAFIKNKEYDKAIWIYINLFPNYKEKVVEDVRSLATELESLDIRSEVRKSFAIYGTFDPAISTFDNGTPTMNMAKLKEKGSWGDQLILELSDSEEELISAKDYNLRGVDKAKIGDFKGAIDDFNISIEMEPTGQAYYNRAYSKSMLEDFKSAIEDFDKTIEFEYRLAEAYFERGYCKDQLNDPSGAISDYSKAIKLKKDYTDAYNNRAFSKFKLKDFKGAIKDFDKALKIKPGYIIGYVNRGFAKKELGDQSGACQDWMKAMELGYQEAQNLIDKYCK